MPTKRVLFFSALFITVSMVVMAAGCGVISGSGDLETHEMDYNDFTELEVGYAFDAEIARADEVEVDGTIPPRLRREAVDLDSTCPAPAADRSDVGLRHRAHAGDGTERL